MQSPSDVHPDGQVVVVVVAVTEAELLQAQPWQEGVLQVLDKEGRVKQQPDDGGIASSCRQVPGCTTAAAWWDRSLARVVVVEEEIHHGVGLLETSGPSFRSMATSSLTREKDFLPVVVVKLQDHSSLSWDTFTFERPVLVKISDFFLLLELFSKLGKEFQEVKVVGWLVVVMMIYDCDWIDWLPQMIWLSVSEKTKIFTKRRRRRRSFFLSKPTRCALRSSSCRRVVVVTFARDEEEETVFVVLVERETLDWLFGEGERSDGFSHWCTQRAMNTGLLSTTTTTPRKITSDGSL